MFVATCVLWVRSHAGIDQIGWEHFEVVGEWDFGDASAHDFSPILAGHFTGFLSSNGGLWFGRGWSENGDQDEGWYGSHARAGFRWRSKEQIGPWAG
jgi:hypothetical protein